MGQHAYKMRNSTDTCVHFLLKLPQNFNGWDSTKYFGQLEPIPIEEISNAWVQFCCSSLDG